LVGQHGGRSMATPDLCEGTDHGNAILRKGQRPRAGGRYVGGLCSKVFRLGAKWRSISSPVHTG